ncbi:MAG: type I-C CRISPR-associated protein Cas5c [Thermodesulfobacteriota bacterium]
MTENLVSVRVWGDFACFTRPEMKVERVSYPVMTPSAARGVLEAIFWEPEVYYVIDSIRVINRGKWASFMRNEVIKVINVNSVTTWMKDPARFEPIQAGGGAKDGTQRNMLALEDVEYIITAELAPTEIGRRSAVKLTKYLNEFKRRAQQGKCFHRPCLGMREFAADFDWEADPQAALERRAVELYPGQDWRLIWLHEDLGLMLYDVFDYEERGHGFRWGSDRAGEISVPIPEMATDVTPDRKPRLRTSVPSGVFEGRKVAPYASYFKARIDEARMECNPARTAIIRRILTEG